MRGTREIAADLDRAERDLAAKLDGDNPRGESYIVVGVRFDILGSYLSYNDVQNPASRHAGYVAILIEAPLVQNPDVQYAKVETRPGMLTRTQPFKH